ncbi:hypothetical protein B0H15DRAFT_1027027 [Mycena belliarum]|uniref:Uncharacterized protein n=1 Tax=Mycena belliarum TaxID=1033014 RepID=A0AAD6TSJ9_9AGAR|nr:hypothetical protein B0H15DRAFT_1027027 [Mycena belliae]
MSQHRPVHVARLLPPAATVTLSLDPGTTAPHGAFIADHFKFFPGGKLAWISSRDASLKNHVTLDRSKFYSTDPPPVTASRVDAEVRWCINQRIHTVILTTSAIELSGPLSSTPESVHRGHMYMGRGMHLERARPILLARILVSPTAPRVSSADRPACAAASARDARREPSDRMARSHQ